MTAYDDIAQKYIDAWNSTDEAARRAAVGGLFAEDVRYVDPSVVAEGRDALANTIAAVQQQFPGFVFRLNGQVDGHHQQVRFKWELGPTDEPAPVAGFDVAVIDAAGRIKTVLGFLDNVPAAG